MILKNFAIILRISDSFIEMSVSKAIAKACDGIVYICGCRNTVNTIVISSGKTAYHYLSD